MPRPGEVFKVFQFGFGDGEYRDKWFVSLNVSDADIPCLALKTTTVPDRYAGCRRACNPERRCFFVPPAWQSCFERDTYIQLPEIFELPTRDLLRDGLAGRLEFKVPLLDLSCFEQLKTCLAGFRRFISEEHWRMIYSRPA